MRRRELKRVVRGGILAGWCGCCGVVEVRGDVEA